jgi:hypothetical protein
VPDPFDQSGRAHQAAYEAEWHEYERYDSCRGTEAAAPHPNSVHSCKCTLTTCGSRSPFYPFSLGLRERFRARGPLDVSGCPGTLQAACVSYRCARSNITEKLSCMAAGPRKLTTAVREEVVRRTFPFRFENRSRCERGEGEQMIFRCTGQ